MKRIIFPFVLAFILISFMYAQDKPASAEEIMNKAQAVAKKENKNIFLMFHASWCGWCKKMDQSMKDDLCKDYFDSNYVTIHMVVKESANNKHLENPGADELLARYEGDRSGIPFWLIFDKNGELIADSFMISDGKKGNIGCPAQENEVAAFIEKLNLAAPLSEEEAKNIMLRFRQNSN